MLSSILAAGLVALAGTQLSLASAQAAAPACSVDYSVQNDWGSGFTANVVITNEGDSAVDGWTLEWDFPGDQQITNIWSADRTQSGQHVEVTAASYRSHIGSGQAVSFGFNATYSGENQKPASFILNGAPCGSEGGGRNQPPAVSLTSPDRGATHAAPAEVELSANASDADGSVASVAFYAGDNLLGTDGSSPYKFTWSSLPAGSYSLTAEATDDDGATTTSAPVGITVRADTGPAVMVSPASVSVPEGGERAFEVSLSEAPAGPVTVSAVRESGDADLSVSSGAELTFTAEDYDTAQQVTLAAAEDGDESNGTATFAVTGPGFTVASVSVREADNDAPQYEQRFLSLYQDIKAPANGYFSPEEIPYHSVEKLMVEAPDYGHETTSETFSYWFWLEAIYGKFTGDWSGFNRAWEIMEKYMIPSDEEQPTNNGHDPSDPADYVGEYEDITEYPAPIKPDVEVGQDPLAQELADTYGTWDVYGMHWLLDTDNWYEYNEQCHPEGERDGGPTFINTFQRGAEESVWETVTHPSCERFNHGSENGGFLTLFVDDEPSEQWRFTNAPDADARVVQVAYWAHKWAEQQGNVGAIDSSVAKAAKMGDYLRYAMYDKYFKQPGCESLSCPAGTGKNSAHYLMSWYYGWGGSLGQYDWAWRIGSSHVHFGYQNPMAAWALSNVDALVPKSPTAQEDWAKSLQRQLDFYQWLQSAEGAIAGGATNSWKGHYAERPEGKPTFHGLVYDNAPVYHDPNSNEWFGWQAWSMERVAELYHVTGNEQAGRILDKWVEWALSETSFGPNGNYRIPSTLSWSGAPDDWNPQNPGDNSNLHVSVENYTQDVGVAGSYAKALMYYAAATESELGDRAQQAAKQLLDGMWQHRDDIGVSVPETREDYKRFDDQVYVPQGWTGEMGTGAPIGSDSTFLSIRPKFESLEQWPKVQQYLDGGEAPTFRYHRFWAQVDVATALGIYAQLFDSSQQ